VEVTDPSEPLFGKQFEVLSISRGDPQAAHVFVKYRDDIVLRLPLRATNLSLLDDHAVRATLSQDAAREFLSLVKEYELCRHKTKSRRAKSGKRSTGNSNKTSSTNSSGSPRR
jgi:hypothetical protein